MNEFDEIRPYEAGEMQQAFKELLADRQFNVVARGLVPWLPASVRNALLRLAFVGVKTPLDFQKRFMKPIVKYIIYKHTDGVRFDQRCLKPEATPRYTFVSNHRDIVLDSAFLDVLLIDNGFPTTVEIGIGDNLLIYPWIKRLVRMNKAFTVKRGLSPKETLRSSQLMSRYIHYTVTQKHENIWIAQREGRAKDSDDHTQDSVLKMLAMGAPEDQKATPADQLKELNIVPLTISYEYDPCDYLKAQELQQRRDNPAFKKSRQDDLDNMYTGIFGYKGRVTYRPAAPINNWIDELADLPRHEFYKLLAERIDREIHIGYQFHPCNHIAFDELKKLKHPLIFTQHPTLISSIQDQSVYYTEVERKAFEKYLQGQLAKIKLENPDHQFLREQILIMYANPLINFYATTL